MAYGMGGRLVWEVVGPGRAGCPRVLLLLLLVAGWCWCDEDAAPGRPPVMAVDTYLPCLCIVSRNVRVKLRSTVAENGVGGNVFGA